MTDDPLAYLAAAHAEAQARAEAAGGDQWTTQEHPADTIAIYDSNRDPVVYDESAPTPEQMDHIAANSPAVVLRRITAERKQLELHAAVPDHGRFSERGCPALCDGEHDAPPVCRSCRDYAGDPIEAPCRTVEILAEGWGWTRPAASHG